MPALTGLVLDSVPFERASGHRQRVFNTNRQVDGALAVAVFGVLLANSATFVTEMQSSFVTAASLLLATALISLRIRS